MQDNTPPRDPSIPEGMIGVNTGWRCPGCGTCYAPWVYECLRCAGSGAGTVYCSHDVPQTDAIKFRVEAMEHGVQCVPKFTFADRDSARVHSSLPPRGEVMTGRGVQQGPVGAEPAPPSPAEKEKPIRTKMAPPEPPVKPGERW